VLVDHVGHVDERVVAVVVGEETLVVRLEAVVELLGQPLPQLGHEGPRLQPREQHPHGAEEQPGVVEVGPDRVADPGVLHLHRHGPAVVGDGAVHLPDRGRRDRPRVPLGEPLLGRRAEVLGHHLGGQLGRHGRGVGLELGQRLAHLGWHPLVEVAGHLAELHHGALHVAERLGDGLRGLQLERGVELDLAIGGGEGPPGAVQRVLAARLGPDTGQGRVARPAGDAAHGPLGRLRLLGAAAGLLHGQHAGGGGGDDADHLGDGTGLRHGCRG
jgi:hypothetical protein